MYKLVYGSPTFSFAHSEARAMCIVFHLIVSMLKSCIILSDYTKLNSFADSPVLLHFGGGLKIRQLH